MKNKKLIFATHNIGKIQEFEQLFSGFGIDFLNLSSFKIEDEPIEDGLTFSQNAEIKLDYYSDRIKKSGFEFKPETYLMSEDSGIEIKYLNGAPGVYSARYAGNNVSYQDNVRKLLSDLKGVEQKFRNAKFRTYISFCSSENEFWVDGSIEGEITEKPLGENGFGYDSVFLVKETGLTFGQMDKKDKDKISHRGLALKKMISLLEQNIN